mgnify:CR=1 FL=1
MVVFDSLVFESYGMPVNWQAMEKLRAERMAKSEVKTKELRMKLVTLKKATDADSFIAEFSITTNADCNNDGIVDYGQILDGTLVDTDQNGVPDWCDSCTGDVNGDGTVDAADLGALLALWGSNGNSSPRADANRDGTVDAADLGLLLGYWGDCP